MRHLFQVIATNHEGRSFVHRFLVGGCRVVDIGLYVYFLLLLVTERSRAVFLKETWSATLLFQLDY